MTLSLAELIAKSKLAAELTEAAKAAKAKAKKAKAPREIAEAEAQAVALQAQIDWRSTTLIFRLIKWECACGHSGTRPDGLFIFQEHARMANSYRFIRPREGPARGLRRYLPRRVQTTTEVVTLCVACTSASGFTAPFVEPPRRLPPSPAREGLGPFVQEFRYLTRQELE